MKITYYIYMYTKCIYNEYCHCSEQQNNEL